MLLAVYEYVSKAAAASSRTYVINKSNNFRVQKGTPDRSCRVQSSEGLCRKYTAKQRNTRSKCMAVSSAVRRAVKALGAADVV